MDSVDFNAVIHFRELPTEYERNFQKMVWSLRNPGKPLPNSAEAKRQMQRLEQAEKELAERKRLLCLIKKKAVKAAKKEADKDGRDKAEEEEVDIPQVGLLISCAVRVRKKSNKDMIHFR